MKCVKTMGSGGELSGTKSGRKKNHSEAHRSRSTVEPLQAPIR